MYVEEDTNEGRQPSYLIKYGYLTDWVLFPFPRRTLHRGVRYVNMVKINKRDEHFMFQAYAVKFPYRGASDR